MQDISEVQIEGKTDCNLQEISGTEFMKKKSRFLEDILHTRSVLEPITPKIEIDSDYIISTQVGYFRMAYVSLPDESKKGKARKTRRKHYIALFYAENREELAAVSKNGQLGIAYKNHVSLIRMQEVAHTPGATWADKSDTSYHLDLSWIGPIIHQVIYDLPRILVRESCLHRLGHDTYASAFVGYQESKPDKDGKSGIKLITRSNGESGLPEMAEDKKAFQSPSALQRTFRWVGRMLTKPGLSHPIPLKITFEHGKTDELRSTFSPAECRPACQADFKMRDELIRSGVDPVHFKEQAFTPILRLQDKAIEHIEKLGNIADDSQRREILERNGIMLLFNIVVDGIFSTIGGFILDMFKDVGLRENIPIVPPEWGKLISHHARRLVSIESRLHHLLIHPNPSELEKLVWLNPKEFACNFVHPARELKIHSVLNPDPDARFRAWLERHWWAPRAVCEYIGANGKLVGKEGARYAKVWLGHVANGVEWCYTPETETLYTYYHRPDYIIRGLNVPADIYQYFEKDQVYAIKLAEPETPMQKIPFAAYEKEIAKLTSHSRDADQGSKDWELPSATTCPKHLHADDYSCIFPVYSRPTHPRHRLRKVMSDMKKVFGDTSPSGPILF